MREIGGVFMINKVKNVTIFTCGLLASDVIVTSVVNIVKLNKKEKESK